MKKRLQGFVVMVLCIIFMSAIPMTVYADIGPKPSVQIKFTGMEGETYYGTLLSDVESTGPATAWNGKEEDVRLYDGTYEIWKKFVDYEDVDGFYFLQRWWDCSETNAISWTYYPPSTFKILLYFPENDTFYVSEIYEKYAFDSYFTVDLSDYTTNGVTAEKSYDYKWECISLVIRIVSTILLELVIAFWFGYREKKLLAFLAVVNTVTQVVLNILLNIVNYNSGSMAYIFGYILFELVVVVSEAFIYASMMGKFSEKQQKKGKAVLYAVIANVVSFIAGIWLSYCVPGIF